MDMDLFTMLGIDTPKMEKETHKKGKKEKKPVKSGKEKKPVEEQYPLPMKIVTGWHEPAEISGEGTVTEKELQEKIQALFDEYTASNMSIQLSADKKTVYVGFRPDAVLAKGVVSVSKETQCRLGNEWLDISTVMEGEEESEVDISDVSDALAEICPIFKGCSFVKTEENLLVPVFKQDVLEFRKMDFPVNIIFFGRGTMQVTKDQYAIQYTSSGEEWDEADGTLSGQVLIDLVIEQFPDLDPKWVKLRYDEESKLVIVVPEVAYKPKAGKTTASKGETFPVENTVLSVIFQKIPLDPSLFGGKTSVTKKELQTYVSGIFPEYSGDNVEFVYHKDQNLIVPILRGSRKGVR